MASRPENAGTEWRRRYAAKVAAEIEELKKTVSALDDSLVVVAGAALGQFVELHQKRAALVKKLDKLRAEGLSDKAKTELAREDPQLYEQFHLDPHYPAPARPAAR